MGYFRYRENRGTAHALFWIIDCSIILSPGANSVRVSVPGYLKGVFHSHLIVVTLHVFTIR